MLHSVPTVQMYIKMDCQRGRSDEKIVQLALHGIYPCYSCVQPCGRSDEKVVKLALHMYINCSLYMTVSTVIIVIRRAVGSAWALGLLGSWALGLLGSWALELLGS